MQSRKRKTRIRIREDKLILEKISEYKGKCAKCSQTIDKGQKIFLYGTYSNKKYDYWWTTYCSNECLNKENEFRATLEKVSKSAKEMDVDFCGLCGSRWDLQRDHIEPRSKGGEDEDWNLQILCGECNIGKGTKDHPNLDFRTREL